MSQRTEKINSLIREKIGEFLKKECSFKSGVFVTIVKVDTSRDFRYSRISVSVFPEKEEEYAMQTLFHERTKLQSMLHKNLFSKILPKISFLLDRTEAHADIVEQLFIEMQKEEKR